MSNSLNKDVDVMFSDLNITKMLNTNSVSMKNVLVGQNKNLDCFSMKNKPNNKIDSPQEEYPGLDGLPQPTHLNNPNRTTGNGRGAVIIGKKIIKHAFVGSKDELLNKLINAVMSDTSLSFQDKDAIIEALKRQPESILNSINDKLGLFLGAGAGATIAKFLLGSGALGTVLGALVGSYIGNNLQNRSRLINNLKFDGHSANYRYDENKITDTNFYPSTLHNPFTIY